MHAFGQAQINSTPRGIYEPLYLPDSLNAPQIAEIESLAQKAGLGPASVGETGKGMLNSSIRRSSVAWLTLDLTPRDVFVHFESVFAKANEYFQFALTGIEAPQFTVYEESVAGEYKWHTDSAPLGDGMIRKLSMSILLSDPAEFEGGRLLLMPGGAHMVAEERLGRAVFFPSWMPHCVTPVTKGVRRSLVIWAHGPAFK